jgi:hypothetical protein
VIAAPLSPARLGCQSKELQGVEGEMLATNLQLTPEPRAQIRQAAEARGASVTKEINGRLRRSLELETRENLVNDPMGD